MKTSFKISLLVGSLGTVSLFAFQNCAPGALNSKTSASVSSSSFSDCGDAVCEVVDTNTIAVSNSQNVLQGMLAKAGVTTPSAATKNAYAAQGTKIPSTGAVGEITAPMWMGLATMSSEVCNDMITQEMAPGATRRVFNSFDFTTGPASQTDAAKSDAIRRMARNFWSRNETLQELTLIKMSVNASFSGTSAADTKKEALYLCTAMLSSTDAQTY